MYLFGINKSVSTDKKLVEEVSTRAIESIYPNKQAFEQALMSGKKLSFYLGIDPTGPTIHLGHIIPLLVLRRLQDLGHDIILLMGDFTAMIGDPSDKTATRKPLTRSEVLKNLENYKKQASSIINFKGKNKARIVFNSKWLSKMSFGDVLKLASKMTVQQMLERDMFEKRMNEGRPIFIHEFLYPLMQGYDSIALDVDGEIGGNDQTFNMLAGRNLMKSVKGKEKFVIATKLLVDTTGQKMGKTEGNMVMLSDTPANTFGKIMSWSDEQILPAFEYATTVSFERIEKIKKDLSEGKNPRDMKADLACEIVTLCFGRKEAQMAKDSFFNTFLKKEIPVDMPPVLVEKGFLSDVLKFNGIVASKTEFQRLADAGAITDLKSNKKITRFDDKIESDMDIKVGKHRFIKIRVK